MISFNFNVTVTAKIVKINDFCITFDKDYIDLLLRGNCIYVLDRRERLIAKTRQHQT